MPAKSAKMEYAAKKTYGTLTYKYAAGAGAAALPAPNERPYTQPDLDRPAGSPEAKPQVRTKTRPRKSAGQRISVFAVGGSLCIVALVILILLGNLRVVMISSETVELEQRLGELQAEGTRLQIKYEKTFDLRKIEEIATRELGMMKMSGNQILYVDTTEKDHTVISERENPGFMDKLKSFIRSILE